MYIYPMWTSKMGHPLQTQWIRTCKQNNQGKIFSTGTSKRYTSGAKRSQPTQTFGMLCYSLVSRHKGGSTQYTGWIHDACVDCAFPIRKIDLKGYSRVNWHWGWVCSMPNFSPVSSEGIFHDCGRGNTHRRFSNAFYRHLWAFFLGVRRDDAISWETLAVW